MKLLFSGATNFKVEQADINKCLGGFMSSTTVPNKKLNALFSDVSNFDLKNKAQNTIGLFLYNDTASNITNISLESIYQNKLGTLINLCDFEFAITEVSSSGSIEMIGSIFEEPFYANWFECESRYEDCTIKLKTFGNQGDDFSIFGILGVLTGNDFDSFSKDIFELINNSTNLSCEIIDNKTIYVKSKLISITNSSSDFITSGNAELESDVNLGNGKDGRTLIYDTLLPDKAIGIWIKRKINDNYKNLNKECQDLKKSNLEKIETLEVIFHHD